MVLNSLYSYMVPVMENEMENEIEPGIAKGLIVVRQLILTPSTPYTLNPRQLILILSTHPKSGT